MDQTPYDLNDSHNEEFLSSMTVRDLPPGMRPREELLRRGATNVADEVLIAIILRSGQRGANVIELARKLLIRAGGLNNLACNTLQEIEAFKIPGIGKVKSMELAAAFELGRRAASNQYYEAPTPVLTPQSAANLLYPLAYGKRQEIFWVLLLNVKNHLICPPIDATKGLLDSSQTHPREIFAPALRHGAKSVILAHNHPSGDTTPSSDDLRVTRQLLEAANILGINVFDHIIIGNSVDRQPTFLSMREKNLITFAGNH